MKVCVIRTGGLISIEELSNDDQHQLSEIQNIIGGYMEPLFFPGERLLLLVNEEGKLQGLPYNCSVLNNDVLIQLVGNIILVGQNGLDFCSITEDEAFSFINKYFRF